MATDRGATKAKRHRLSERSRMNIVLIVAAHMNECDLVRIILGVKDGEEFKLGAAQRNSTTEKGTIGKAVDFILKRPELIRELGFSEHLRLKERKQAIENACRAWMAAWGHKQRSRLADLPRKTRTRGVKHDDMLWLGDLLVSVEYTDEYGNERRFGTLEDILQYSLAAAADGDLSDGERAKAHDRASRMMNIMAGGNGKVCKGLNVIQPDVVALCGYGSGQDTPGASPLYACSMVHHARVGGEPL